MRIALFLIITVSLQGCSSMSNGVGHMLRSGEIEEYGIANPGRSAATEAIRNEKVFIGMTEHEAYLSWGAPTRKNRTTTVRGVRERWVYGRNYLYFENGILAAIKN
jgi:hypothetical protein